MMFKYLWTKPAGGGPAPLLQNPVRGWMVALVVAHLLLFLMAGFTFTFPSITDMFCSLLSANASYCAVCGAVAFSMFFYFSVLSCQTWGTEQYWTTFAVVTLSMAFVDSVTAGWGIYVLTSSTRTLRRNSALAIEESCEEWKAVAFYYCAAAVISFHVVIALLCGAVSFRMTRGVSSQLEEIRRLV
ncbi:membrane protein [Cystoisospora suis]|uniref:Membrane protein n=1 Tax=Cystoisospora suis TaxID=483139 RepID=A0A2C6L9X7_9APIC|nr:membrane protein [Cystoisospora suis]